MTYGIKPRKIVQFIQMFWTFITAILPTVFAGHPTEEFCRKARFVYTITGSQCAIASIFPGPHTAACGVGVSIFTISVELSCYSAGHFVDPGLDLPPIARWIHSGASRK
jgi:hypothetical protein